jgi:aspartate racemase
VFLLSANNVISLVGPMAGVALQEKIINATKGVKVDQHHLSVLHFCCPSFVNDRTKWLLDGSKTKSANPAKGMFQVAKALSSSAHTIGMSAVVGVPCNTFHSDAIFKEFLRQVDDWNRDHDYTEGSPGHLKVLNMIELTLQHITEMGASRIGLLSTTGTRETSVYDKISEVMGGMDIVYVEDDQQESVQDAIYNPEDGIKALSKASDRVVETLTNHVENLVNEQGAEAVVLGCTELPLALPQSTMSGVELVDPMDVLAAALVSEALGIKSH